MTKIITTRLDEDIAGRLEQAVHNAQTDKATFLRILIVRGLEDVEKEKALILYKKGEISLGKLAELLKITKWDAFDLIKNERIPLHIDEEDIRAELALL